ncbi:MAG: glutamine-hydrolyzing carbamoyl-phosphate synthase small subunit [Bacillota bacterium]
MKGVLVLEDGTVFHGESCGKPGQTGGEVVFSTAMTGYQEVFTDPSFAGQIVALTYPLVGNYGISACYQEAARAAARGIIIKEEAVDISGGAKVKRLSQFLEENDLVGIKGVDTRTLTKHLRTHGTMRGIISTLETPVDVLVQMARELPLISEQKLTEQVSTADRYILPGSWPTVAVLDLGVKSNSIRTLSKLGCTVVVLPAYSTPGDIMAVEPDGLFISNGPGDPKSIPQVTETVRSLLGCLPMMGICMGHQILALALGADTYKMKFGHRGGNQPVKDLATGRVYITSQNHGFSIRPESLPHDTVVTHINLNDGTIEGIKHKHLPLFSVQFHPEGAPGPRDTTNLFIDFMRNMSLQGGGHCA